ncbi:hypothetical protein GCM10009682_28700 [Luedemannella flava]|uniref:Uncharacterized protein n=1 Tax=Luedemannella flava TaxID=349316 RepID=A0ABN2M0J7_9ACTN
MLLLVEDAARGDRVGEFAEPAWFPNVDVYAEKGSAVPTVVGATLPNLEVGQVLDFDTAELFVRDDGDGNQEVPVPAQDGVGPYRTSHWARRGYPP